MDEPAAGTACRGIRGAITADSDEPEEVAAATTELLDALVEANGCRLDDLAAVVFTVTDDLQGSNPAAAASSGAGGGVGSLEDAAAAPGSERR